MDKKDLQRIPGHRLGTRARYRLSCLLIVKYFCVTVLSTAQSCASCFDSTQFASCVGISPLCVCLLLFCNSADLRTLTLIHAHRYFLGPDSASTVMAICVPVWLCGLAGGLYSSGLLARKGHLNIALISCISVLSGAFGASHEPFRV